MKLLKAAILAWAVLFLVTVAPAQSVSGEWRTTATEHFRVHYPVGYEGWALRAAGRLESIREIVAEEVGWPDARVVDVLVQDPMASANGMAWPVLDGPRMILWTNPPGARSILSNFEDWPEMLMLHEEVHILHLIRPSRNRLRQWVSMVLPFGPLATGAPRWVTEGYATLVEGKLTGAGRPYGNMRAAILREWARSGRLPTYGQLASGGDLWLGGGFAYLVGSAYLEWLTDRAGEGSLRKLWLRMSAKETRSFEQAFTGVFGDPPAKLYGRFAAELTYKALEAEQRLEPFLAEGELWQATSWATGAPAPAPDGNSVAVVLRSRKQPSRLVVFDSGENIEAEKEFQDNLDRILAADPEDVAPVRRKPLGRKPVYTLPAAAAGEPYGPRWMPDGGSILFVRMDRDRSGFLHPDIHRWFPESGRLVRVTREADVRDPDPAPDGTWAVAVRNRMGSSELVRVDLATGAVSRLPGSEGPSLDLIYDQPRISPDGEEVAVVRHSGDGWELVLISVADGEELVVPTGLAGSPAYPCWSHDGGSLYISAGRKGFVDIFRLDTRPGVPPRRLTRTLGASLAPAPVSDGSRLFFLALTPDGYEIRTLQPGGPAPSAADPDLADLAPAVPQAHQGTVVRIQENPPEPGVAYGAGRQELRPILGWDHGSHAGQVHLGLRGGDLLGRGDWLVLGGTGSDAGPEGVAAAGTWRGWPIALGIHLYWAESRPSSYREPNPAIGADLDLRRKGAEIEAGWSRQWNRSRLDLAAAVLFESVTPAFGSDLSRKVGALTSGWRGNRRLGSWTMTTAADLGARIGETGGDSWNRYQGRVRFAIGKGRFRRAQAAYHRATTDEAMLVLDRLQLGGMESSILPGTLNGARMVEPALPAGHRIGDDYEGRELSLGPVFYRDHRLTDAAGGGGERLALAGLEFGFGTQPNPVLRLPGLKVRAGAGRVLDGPLDGDNRFWVNMVWRP